MYARAAPVETSDYNRQKAAFLEARDQHGDQRRVVLDRCCAGDGALRARVETLLEKHDQGDDLLEFAPAALLAGGPSQFGPDEPEPDLPERIGQFRITGLLGKGGMGIVYEATQEHPNRPVALKVIHPGVISGSARRRFRQEVEALGRMSHPGIARIYEAGTTDDGRPYFAMERVDGVPITRFAASRDTRARLGLIGAIAEAVDHAHRKGVVHRDLKPDNILVDAAGKVKILDFGVARSTDSDMQVTSIHTHVGQIIGTLPYMSPEQVSGDPSRVDGLADVYALGVIAYETLTGSLPYDVRNKSIPEMVRIIQQDPPTPISSFSRVLRGDLETITAKALEKEPSRRYASAAAMAEDIARFLRHEPILARRPSTAYQFRKLVVRHKVVFGLIGLLFAAVLGFGVWMALLYRHAEDLRIAANMENEKSVQIQTFLQEIISTAIPGAHGHDLTMKEALQLAGKRIDEEFEGYPEVEAALRFTIGDAFHSLRYDDLALPHLERAVELRLLDPKAEGQPLAQALVELSRSYRGLNRFDEAVATLNKALAVPRTDNLEPTPAAMTNSLGLTYKKMGRTREAQALYRQAVELARAQPGRPHRLATCLANLAGTLSDVDEKEALLLEALQIQRTLDAPGALMSTLGGLANVAMAREDWATAESYAQQRLQFVLDFAGEGSIDYALSLRLMGVILREAGRMEEAEQWLLSAIDACDRHSGTQRRESAMIRFELGRLYEQMERYEDARRVYQETLDIRHRILPDDHPDINRTLTAVARTLSALGRDAEAAALLEERRPMNAASQGESDSDRGVAPGAAEDGF